MGHGPDAPREAQDAGARVFDCMLREADDLLEEAQAEWFCAADRPEAALEGLRAAGFLAAVGVWLAAMRAEPGARAGFAPGLAPVLPPPRDPEAAEDPSLQRLRALGARAARLYERAARLDGLLSGREEGFPVGSPPASVQLGDSMEPPAAGAAVTLTSRARPLAAPFAKSVHAGFDARPDLGPGARDRQIWLSRALAEEAWG